MIALWLGKLFLLGFLRGLDRMTKRFPLKLRCAFLISRLKAAENRFLILAYLSPLRWTIEIIRAELRRILKILIGRPLSCEGERFLCTDLFGFLCG